MLRTHVHIAIVGMLWCLCHFMCLIVLLLTCTSIYLGRGFRCEKKNLILRITTMYIMYTYIYIYIHICIHVCVYIYIYIERERERYICVYIYIYVHVCVYVYIYIYTHTYTYVYTHTHTYMCWREQLDMSRLLVSPVELPPL